MNIEQMRVWISEQYTGDKWARRVKNMSDSQVIAVYFRMNQEKK